MCLGNLKVRGPLGILQNIVRFLDYIMTTPYGRDLSVAVKIERCKLQKYGSAMPISKPSAACNKRCNTSIIQNYKS